MSEVPVYPADVMWHGKRRGAGSGETTPCRMTGVALHVTGVTV